MSAEDHERLAEELAEETEKLGRESAELEDEIATVRQDWRAKQNDPGVPGAVNPSPRPDGADRPDRRSNT